jgi:hypothetical protein
MMMRYINIGEKKEFMKVDYLIYQHFIIIILILILNLLNHHNHQIKVNIYMIFIKYVDGFFLKNKENYIIWLKIIIS